MKKLFYIYSILFFTSLSLAQEKLITKNGKVVFEASMPSFEEIKAKNENASCVVNTTTGEIASLVLIKGFRFKIALMEEHFNENYIESDKYPKATFKGKILNFDWQKVDKNFKEYTMRGVFELHGKTKEMNIIAKIRKNNGTLELVSDFKILISDFDIEIPSVVTKKIAKTASVSLDYTLK